MTKEEWIKIYNAKDGTWDKDYLIDKAYEIMTSPIRTNYDRIKSMSVEEMAEYLSDHWSCIDCAFEKDCDDNYISCHKNIKQWLEQEVNDEEKSCY